MYIPEHFKETDPERIISLVEDHPFGMMVTVHEGAPFVSHLPFLLDSSAARKGRLLGHMARANPQWRHFVENSEVLVVFQGPHGYVSPSWYVSPGVPTWNYAVVHLRGKPRLIEEESELQALLERLTHAHESHRPIPWQSGLVGERRAKLLEMIVGFEIEITEIQAKFKLSQNRSPEDRQRVAAALGEQGDAALAELMTPGFNAGS